jgi:hypothetical protein
MNISYFYLFYPIEKTLNFCGRRCPFYPLFTLVWTNVYMPASSLFLAYIWVMGRDEHEQRKKKKRKERRRKSLVCLHIWSWEEKKKRTEEKKKLDDFGFCFFFWFLSEKEKPDWWWLILRYNRCYILFVDFDNLQQIYVSQ